MHAVSTHFHAFRGLGALALFAAMTGCPTPMDIAADSGSDARLGDGGALRDADVDAGFDDDAGVAEDTGSASDAGEERRCRTATAAVDCDDGNPRTRDECFTVGAPDGLGWCIWTECALATDCDDADPLTFDSCDASSRLCDHTLFPNRCRSVSDCGDAATLSCVTASCDARALCAFDWTDGCGVEPSPEPPSCASVGAVSGASCCEGATCEWRCNLSGAGTPCPRRLECTAGRYAIVEAAGPSCAPSACTSSPPAASSACGPLGTICDYAPTRREPSAYAPSEHLGDLPRCQCTAAGWSCVGDVCPSRPPSDDTLVSAPVWWSPGGVICRYLGRECRTEYDALRQLRWQCVTPLVCPVRLSAPGASEPCLVGADDTCDYARDSADEAVTTYTGSCECAESGEWMCEPSRSSACPDLEPPARETCVPERGNDSCVYFRAGGGRVSCRCGFAMPGFPTWICG